MGAELSRKRRGKKTRTGMSESQLEDFASKELDDSFTGDEVMEKNAIKSITKYLGKTDKDFKTALDAFSTKPKTSAEAAAHGYPKGLAPEERSKYDEAAAKITPPKRVVAVEKGIGDIARKLTGQKPKQAATSTPRSLDAISRDPKTQEAFSTAGKMTQGMGSVDKQEDGYPPTKGERREAKRAKAKKMKVTGHGTKNLERIIGVKAAKARGEDVNKGFGPKASKEDKPVTPRVKPVTPRVKSEKQLVKAISTYLKEEEYPKSKAIDLTGAPKPPKEMMDRARKALAGARTARRAAKNGKPASGDEVAMKAIEKIAAYNKGLTRK